MNILQIKNQRTIEGAWFGWRWSGGKIETMNRKDIFHYFQYQLYDMKFSSSIINRVTNYERVENVRNAQPPNAYKEKPSIGDVEYKDLL